MSKLSEEEARDKVFNDYLYNITKSVRKIRVFYKTTVDQLEEKLVLYRKVYEKADELLWLGESHRLPDFDEMIDFVSEKGTEENHISEP